MEFQPLRLSGAYLINYAPYKDERGTFTRLFCSQEFAKIAYKDRIVQINHSRTEKRGAIRGMHYQKPPKQEIKIITCIRGAAYDVMVDIRRKSATYLQAFAVHLSAEISTAVYIPKGFAHGFQTLSEDTELLYFHSEFYDAQTESGLNFADRKLAIQWPLPISEISEKDRRNPLINDKFKGL